ncbi:hypothetical protein EXN24_24720 [Rhizobium rhizogenes]|jgi:hypothetical protein|uniref:Uncharacterized protein n=2 Tax=Rhizobium/Agrobacterium group TaxID=227290 RepID=A0AB36EM53_AGRTU|nr:MULTISPECIES: hypothetical protein [Rhizobium/Agrobacterium group]KQY40288.1 hypothetical protein ASD46_19120 [Rhizobium sp. Root491]TRA84943.1 hypothetical protein EXN24_24720 [Rhizobium rhizogenes]HCV72654.1 hypothetical protein [Agrobacterium sp.]KAA3499729.1 hypothetical protein DXM26_22210 [Agrobacterium tumefaciens]KAA3522517.1 hypothetical protein DXM29_21850 [Agrobacterium tumefaciens]
MKGKTMNSYNDQRRQALRIEVWENEGGTSVADTVDSQYGRRIERDQTWTIYHVFTGVPVRVGGRRLTELSISEATDGMLSLNRRNVLRREERSRCEA